MTARIDPGTQIGRLTLRAILAERSADKHVRGLWACECGALKEIAVSRVKNGYTQSCGCLSIDVSRARNRKHGMRQSREYSSWLSMKARCLDTGSKDYPNWGGKGISIHEEWIGSFEAFYSHIGPRPRGTTLDRIDGERGYVPGNVRWATPTVQASNRLNGWTVEIHGKRYQSVQAAAVACGVSDMTIVRWCDGYIDKRRNGTIHPKPNCRRWRTYA